MGSSPDINYPAQPSYGEGMREALEAQVALLTGGKVGQADFREVGSLESLLPLEESIRKKTAQTDTDILRQTLLGGGNEEKYTEDGRVIVGYERDQGTGGRYKIEDTSTGTTYRAGGPQGRGFDFNWGVRVIDTATGNVVHEENGKFNQAPDPAGTGGLDPAHQEREKKIATQNSLKAAELFNDDQINTYLNAEFPEALVLTTDGQVDQSKPIFKKNPDGTDFVAEAGTFEPGEVVRTGDGMVDLLGDRRAVQEFETRTATQADVDAGLADEVGAQFVTQKPTTRQAGFDESGNFLGLAALSEDLQRSNLSRQREADLQDVSRLSGLYSDIMQDYKPGTQEALQSARDVLEAQGENLTGAGAIDVPDPTAFSNVQAGQMSGDLGLGEDALRTALLTDAKQALGQGLTDREERQIAEAARARSTMMGRTFDQSGAIAEAEARVAEDNQRRMQNRAFAQQALGQEAGLQESDLRRDMQAELANQQGSQFGAGAKMDAQRLNEQLRQQGTLGYLQAAGQLAALEDRTTLDPFQAVLGRGGGNALQQGQSVFGQAGYGLQSGPQYLNPEAGLGFIQNQATNAANMYGAQLAADATRDAGMMNMFGSIAGAGLGGFLKRK